MNPSTVLVLASASPRRAELLRAAEIPFEVRAADVDESARDGEAPETYVCRLAEAKAAAIAALGEPRAILGADTVVVVDGRMLGKPRDGAEARAMLQALAGRTHLVFTGVCLVAAEGFVAGDTAMGAAAAAGLHPAAGPDPSAGRPDRAAAPRLLTVGGRPGQTRLSRTTVEMGRIHEAELDWYAQSDEPLDKAGGYAIQGRASRYVTRIDGSYSNVVGLPVALVHAMCSQWGILVS